ncbi:MULTISPECIES: Crp/Fnr family transcriptional regulator [Giesbergeria]|uniref:Crp/Fnr family transcriptional regulator n=1 Tax=Giesbergeria sinuosa TaxID=80883 RepID=A0ABV9QES6_9BURK
MAAAPLPLPAPPQGAVLRGLAVDAAEGRAADCARCACQRLCLMGKMAPEVRPHWQSLVTERSFAKGSYLLRQGEALTVFRIVKVGTTMLLRSSEYGIERPVGLCGHGQTLGSTMLLGQPAMLSCIAMSPVRICEVPIAPLLAGGLVNQTFLWELAVAYAQTNAQMADWARLVRIPTVAGQVAAALLQLATLQRSTLVRLPSQSALAALLATTRETIARTLRQLELEDCLVRRDRWHCEIRRELLLARCGEGQTALPS